MRRVPPVVVVSGSLLDRAEQFAATVASVPMALEVATRNFASALSTRSSTPQQLADTLERGTARPLWDAGNKWTSGFEAAQRQFGVTLQERFGSDGNRHAIAALAPDVIRLAQRRQLGRRVPAGPLGCTSLAVLPRATQEDALLFGRAHDVAGALPGESQLVLHVPKRGLSHLSLHTGGAFLPGFSAVNESGLCVGVHPATSTSVRPDGVPLAAIAARLIETADSLDAAIEQLASVSAASAAAFALAHRSRAAVVEIDGRGRGAVLYPPRNHLAVGAPLRTRKNADAFSATELDREQGWARLARLNALVRQTNAHSLASVATALGDDRDAYEPYAPRAFGNTVFDLCQVGAFVVDNSNDTLLLPSGHARASGWQSLSLSGLFAQAPDVLNAWHEHEHDHDPPPLVVMSGAKECPALTPAARAAEVPREQARAMGQRASSALVREPVGALDAAVDLLDNAMALDDTEPLYALALALVHHQQTDFEAMEPLCEAAAERETSPYRRGLACYLAAKAALSLRDSKRANAWKKRAPDLIWGAHPRLLRRIQRLTARNARAPLGLHAAHFDALFAPAL